jgi:hypothetical protein
MQAFDLNYICEIPMRLIQPTRVLRCAAWPPHGQREVCYHIGPGAIAMGSASGCVRLSRDALPFAGLVRPSGTAWSHERKATTSASGPIVWAKESSVLSTRKHVTSERRGTARPNSPRQRKAHRNGDGIGESQDELRALTSNTVRGIRITDHNGSQLANGAV